MAQFGLSPTKSHSSSQEYGLGTVSPWALGITGLYCLSKTDLG